VKLFWIRNASLAEVKTAPALFSRVKLPVIALFGVSMPRDVAEIVPLLVMTTPGDASPVDQVMAVPTTDSELPAATKPVSLFDTDWAAVLFGGVLKLPAIAEETRPRDVAETTNASRLAWPKNSTFTDYPHPIPGRNV
jgi:hypothetical protein